MEQEQKRLLIRGARILNPARGEDYIGNILISGDRISAVSENLYDADAEVIEAKGLTAVPALWICMCICVTLALPIKKIFTRAAVRLRRAA